MDNELSSYRLLTYRALSEVWDCSVEAAQERVRRRRWPKRKGNGREILVAVPLHELEKTVGHEAPRDPVDLGPNSRPDGKKKPGR